MEFIQTAVIEELSGKMSKKVLIKKGMVEGVLLNALGVCFNLVLGSRCTFL